MKSDKVYLLHIRDAIKTILLYTEGFSEADFGRNGLVRDAVIRNFEIVSEAPKRVSSDTRQNHPNIPWAKMAGMRDKLIHDYIEVDTQKVWDVVDKILPQLLNDVERIIPIVD